MVEVEAEAGPEEPVRAGASLSLAGGVNAGNDVLQGITFGSFKEPQGHSEEGKTEEEGEVASRKGKDAAHKERKRGAGTRGGKRNKGKKAAEEGQGEPTAVSVPVEPVYEPAVQQEKKGRGEREKKEVKSGKGHVPAPVVPVEAVSGEGKGRALLSLLRSNSSSAASVNPFK